MTSGVLDVVVLVVVFLNERPANGFASSFTSTVATAGFSAAADVPWKTFINDSLTVSSAFQWQLNGKFKECHFKMENNTKTGNSILHTCTFSL